MNLEKKNNDEVIEVPASKSGLGTEERLELAQARLQSWIENDFAKKHLNKALTGLTLLLVGIGAYSYHKTSVKQHAFDDAETLGAALIPLYQGNDAAAKTKLAEVAKKPGLSELTTAKAALLLGNIQYNSYELDQAKASFEKALANADQSPVIKAGAESGLAAILIQKKDYAGAVKSLEKFVADYGKRSTKAEEIAANQVEEDLAPNVGDALFKLALCYNKLNQADKAKATAEKILIAYPNSRSSDLAKKLLATL